MTLPSNETDDAENLSNSPGWLASRQECSPGQSVFATLDPIGLDEMDRVKLMNRVDTKYVFAEHLLEPLLAEVRAEYRVLEVGGVRQSDYQTLYFDTDAHDCFVEHHNGKLNRHKFRMRSYASSGACFFEVKAKNNKGRTDKQRIPISEIAEQLSPEAMTFLTEALSAAAAKTQARPDRLQPQLWTDFSRATLVNRKVEERTTLDTNLQFRFGERHCPLPGVVIAEVKQARSDRSSPLRVALRKLGVRPLRVSKYCLGTALLKPQLKSNRFKEKLRAVMKLA